MLLNALNKANDRWASGTQPNLMEGNITAVGAGSTYTLSFKNGGKAYNVSGPAGLSVGNAVVAGVYPGKAKKYAILQKTTGGGTQTITTLQV